MPPIMEPGEFFMPYPLEVEVGGATVFVLPVERFERLCSRTVTSTAGPNVTGWSWVDGSSRPPRTSWRPGAVSTRAGPRRSAARSGGGPGRDGRGMVGQLAATADALVALVGRCPTRAFELPGGEGDWNVAEAIGHDATARAGLVLAGSLAAAGRWPADAPTVVPGVPAPADADAEALVAKIEQSQRIVARAARTVAGTRRTRARSTIRSSAACAAASGSSSPASTTSCTSTSSTGSPTGSPSGPSAGLSRRCSAPTSSTSGSSAWGPTGDRRSCSCAASPGRILPGLWQGVSGSLEAGERIAAGALRELREETGFAGPAIEAFYDLDLVNQFHEPRVDAIVSAAVFAVRVGPAAEPRPVARARRGPLGARPPEALDLVVWPAYRSAIDRYRARPASTRTASRWFRLAAGRVSRMID